MQKKMTLLFSLISKKCSLYTESAYLIKSEILRPWSCRGPPVLGLSNIFCCHLTARVQTFHYSESSWARKQILRIHNTWATSLKAHLLTCSGAYKYMTLSSSEIQFSLESPKSSQNYRNFSSSMTTEQLHLLMKTCGLMTKLTAHWPFWQWHLTVWCRTLVRDI